MWSCPPDTVRSVRVAASCCGNDVRKYSLGLLLLSLHDKFVNVLLSVHVGLSSCYDTSLPRCCAVYKILYGCLHINVFGNCLICSTIKAVFHVYHLLVYYYAINPFELFQYGFLSLAILFHWPSMMSLIRCLLFTEMMMYDV